MIPSWFRREITLGDTGPDVAIVRRKLGFDPEGSYDRSAMEVIRGMGSKSGRVTRAVAERLGESASAGLAPSWYRRDLQLWFAGPDVRALRGLLGLGTRDDRYDPDLEAAVRRFQSARRLKPDGIVTETLARLIGE